VVKPSSTNKKGGGNTSSSGTGKQIDDEDEPASDWRSCFLRSFAHCAKFAIEYDSLLLILSQIVTAIGLVILFVPQAATSLDLTTAGFVLVWSLAGPVADVLTVSMYSVLLSELDLREEVARSMASITAAGSVGRIIFPLLFSVASQSITLFVGAVFSVGCAILAFVYVVGTPNAAANTLRRAMGLREIHVEEFVVVIGGEPEGLEEKRDGLELTSMISPESKHAP
jgi:hypothetical protein